MDKLNKFLTEDITKVIEDYQIGSTNTQFLQCGSSIDNPWARDIDIIVYTCDDLKIFFDDFETHFMGKHIIKKKYIEIWKMYSLKIMEQNKVLSFHIVSLEDLKNYISRAGDSEIYVEINLFTLSMKLPTVYRKWINDTIHLYGNSYLKEELVAMLGQHKMPIAEIQSLLKARIINSINYYFEKCDSDLFSGIVISQIFNDVVLYCYAGNNAFYGTLKYIESDLNSFEKCVDLSKLSLDLFKSINNNTSNIEKHFNMIKELL